MGVCVAFASVAAGNFVCGDPVRDSIVGVLKDTMLTLILSVLLFGGTLVMEWGGLGMIHSWSINTLLDGHRLLQSGGMQFALTVLVFWGVLPLAAGTVLHRVYKKRGQAIWN